jgi:hypothetical protein
MALAVLVVGAVLIGMLVAGLVGALVRLLLFVLFLPIRLIGWILFLPLLLVRAVAFLAALLLSPVLAVLAVIGVAMAAGIFLPLLPLLVVGGLVWIVVRAVVAPKRPAVS